VVARCESGIEDVHREPIALEPLLQETWRPFAPEAARKKIAVRFDLPTDAIVESDRALLRIILVNLLSNAAEYAAAGGAISISATAMVDTIRLQVANSITNLARADLPHLFDRFWRKNAARTSSQRAGLGLSISRAGAQLLGLDLRADIPEPKTFVVTLMLPVAPTKTAGMAAHYAREALP